jgi:DNA-binding GntR family transcriptional regulator
MTTSAPPLVEQAFERLRRDVLTGAFAAGSKLKVEELQATYGVSSSPLREALNRLAQEGLVRADERRGFRVAALSLDDLHDITQMRLMLEVHALREAIERGSDAWRPRSSLPGTGSRRWSHACPGGRLR